MSKGPALRALVSRTLAAAAEEIFGLFERTIAEYEAERRELLDGVVFKRRRRSSARAGRFCVTSPRVVYPGATWLTRARSG